MNKVAVIVFTEIKESHAAMARVLNALHIVREFAEAGDDAQLIFDGGGVVSAAEIAQPDHNLHQVYLAVRDHIKGACAFCAKAFDVRDTLETASIPLLTDYKQHPSIRSLVTNGYQVITM